MKQLLNVYMYPSLVYILLLICLGKKEEMLLREKEYINGEYLPFESSGKELMLRVLVFYERGCA